MKTVGTFIKERRKQKNLTQEALTKMAEASSVRTIQRIESGYVKTYLHTIYPILSALNISHEEFDGMCYGINIRTFYSDVEHIWDMGPAKNYDAMPKMIEELKEKYGKQDRPTVKQAILLLEGAVLCDKYKDYTASLATMYEALKLTTTDIVSDIDVINCRKVSNIVFSLYEYRILRFIANLYALLGESEKSLGLNKAIVVSLERDTNDYGLQKKLIPLTFFNLSNRMIDAGDHADALILTEKGLGFCYQTKEFKYLGNLLWNKGKASYYLGDVEKATTSFQESYSFFTSKQEYVTAKYLQEVAKEKYNLILG